MLDLEPPQVPLEPKQQGFFKKLFSKQKDEQPPASSISTVPDNSSLVMPDAPEPDSSDLPNTDADGLNDSASLPIMPDLGEPEEQPVPKRKGAKKRYSRYDESKSFDWTAPIKEQEKVVNDSSRNNESINVLLAESEQNIEEQRENAQPGALMTEHEELEVPHIEVGDLAESHVELNEALNPKPQEETIVPTMPVINPVEQKEFDKIDKEHQKIRDELSRKASKKDIKRAEFLELLKKYDDRIEKRIEEKQLELSDRRDRLDAFQKKLQSKEKEIKKLHSYLKSLDKALSDKEQKLNHIISTAVDKQLAKRSVKEKALLKKEIVKTVQLNKRLQRKLDVIEKDRTSFERKRDELLEDEQERISASQAMYERKLSELDAERKEFEARRKAALTLLGKADEIGSELKQLEKVRDFVEKSRTRLEKDIVEDKELKEAIENAQKKLVEDKENLDKMIFSKYIESKLSSIVPSRARSKQDIDVTYEANEIYSMIKRCKQMLLNADIEGAKRIYNDVKRVYEQSKFDPIEKAMLYNSIRALYSEIEISSIEKAKATIN